MKHLSPSTYVAVISFIASLGFQVSDFKSTPVAVALWILTSVLFFIALHQHNPTFRAWFPIRVVKKWLYVCLGSLFMVAAFSYLQWAHAIPPDRVVLAIVFCGSAFILYLLSGLVPQVNEQHSPDVSLVSNENQEGRARELEGEVEASGQKATLKEADYSAVLRERDDLRATVGELRGRVEELERETLQLEAEWPNVEAEKVELRAEIDQRDERIAALQKPQVELAFEFSEPYRHEILSPDRKQKRVELCIGVRCYAEIEGLKVELEGKEPETMGGKIYHRVQLREKEGAAPDKGELPHERLFHLAEAVEPGGELRIPADNTEGYPLTFDIIVTGNNTLPLQRRGHVSMMGTFSKLLTFQFTD